MRVAERLSISGMMAIAGLASLICAGAIDANREIPGSLFNALRQQAETLHVTGIYFLTLAALVALVTGLQTCFVRQPHS